MALLKTVYDFEEDVRDLGGNELESLLSVVLRRLRDLNFTPEHEGLVSEEAYDDLANDESAHRERLDFIETELSGLPEELEGIAKRLGNKHPEFARVNYVASRLERVR